MNILPPQPRRPEWRHPPAKRLKPPRSLCAERMPSGPGGSRLALLKSRRMAAAACLLLLLPASGCNRSPDGPPPDQLTLYALNPISEPPGATPGAELLHGYRILGRSVIKEPDRRASLMAAILKSAQESDGHRANCFNPRHGLRVKSTGVIKEYVICFECSYMEVHSGGAMTGVPITQSARPLFNRCLREEGLPVQAGPAR